MKMPEELAIIMKLSGKNGKVKFPIYETDEFYATDVDALDLDTRGKRALHEAHIKTVRNLVNKWNELDKIKGAGIKTINHIRESLAAYQYALLSDVKKEHYLVRVVELNAGG